MCEYGHRETFLKEQAGSRRVSFITLALDEVNNALENSLIPHVPHVYLDIDKRQDGIVPDEYPQLAAIVRNSGHDSVTGAVPGVPVGQDDLALVSGVSVRLPVLRQRETDTYLVAGGYPALEPSGINALDCVIVRQWAEQAIIHCSPERVHNGTIEVPLTYSGAARLKVHRDAVVVPVP